MTLQQPCSAHPPQIEQSEQSTTFQESLFSFGYDPFDVCASWAYQMIVKRRVYLFERVQGGEQADAVASFLRANPARDDLVLVWSVSPMIFWTNVMLQLSNCRSVLFILRSIPSLREMRVAHLRVFVARPTKMIVDASPALPDHILSLSNLSCSDKGSNGENCLNFELLHFAWPACSRLAIGVQSCAHLEYLLINTGMFRYRKILLAYGYNE